MKINKEPYLKIVKQVSLDLIDLMDESGAMNSLLTIDDLLKVMAAPCSRWDEEGDRKYKLMVSVIDFMRKHKWAGALDKETLKKALDLYWLPNLMEDKKRELIKEFSIILDFDSDGYAILNPDRYATYKTLDRKHSLVYKCTLEPGETAPLPPSDVVNFKTYCSYEADGGYWCVDLECTAEQWYNIIKGCSSRIKEMLFCYLRVEGHRASPYMIEQKYGMLCESVNACNTALGRRAKKYLRIDIVDPEGIHRCWSAAMNRGRSEDMGFVWEMRPELVQAVAKLAAEEMWGEKVFI